MERPGVDHRPDPPGVECPTNENPGATGLFAVRTGFWMGGGVIGDGSGVAALESA